METEVEINRIEDAPKIVVASCVLHDVCVIAEDDVDEFLEDGYDGNDDDDDAVGDDEFPIGRRKWQKKSNNEKSSMNC